MKEWNKLNKAGKAAVLDFFRVPHGIKPGAPRRPRTVADGPTEHQIQAAVISWWSHACAGWSLPYYLLFAIPNGGARDQITGARLKAEGVRRGIPDLMLAVPTRDAHGLFIEMKLPDREESDAQKTVSLSLSTRGYTYRLCLSTEEAIDAIKAYLAD